jgi:arylsulfatase A-like enzyme
MSRISAANRARVCGLPRARGALALLITGACGGPDARYERAVDLLQHVEGAARAGSSTLLESLPSDDLEGAWIELEGAAGSRLLARPIADPGGDLRLMAQVRALPAELALARIAGELPRGEPDAAARAAWRAELARGSRGAAAAAPGELAVDLARASAAEAPGYVVLGLAAADPRQAFGRVSFLRQPEHEIGRVREPVSGIDFAPDGPPVVGPASLAGDRRPALVIPCGQALTIACDGPAARLEFAAGALCGGEPAALAPVELEIVWRGPAGGFTLADRILLDPSARLADAFWRERSLLGVDVGGGGGRNEIELSASGPRGCAVAVAHPTLLPEPGAERRPNLVLISLDTLRADRLGCLGGPSDNTPVLDALARQGALFEAAASTAPYTLPAHGTMLTGLYPTVHGAVDQRSALGAPAPEDLPLLARLLHAQGYATAAFTGGGYLAPDYGFASGFERYGVHDPILAEAALPAALPEPADLRSQTADERRALVHAAAARAARVPAIESWIAAHADRPFFLFVHTFATHNYWPPPEDYARVVAPRTRSQLSYGRELWAWRTAAAGKAEVLSPEDHEHLGLLYDATIQHADREVGRLLGALAAAGLDGRTVVCVTSDHGEEFGEHGIYGHSRSLYESLLHVPLLIRGPDVATQRVAEPFSLVDLAPTLLDLLGLARDPRMQGSAWRLGAGGEGGGGGRPASAIFGEVANKNAYQDALRAGPYKLVAERGGARRELYDLTADPDEQRDLARERAGLAGELGQRLDDVRAALDELRRGLGSGAPAAVSTETLQALQDLGYAGE